MITRKTIMWLIAAMSVAVALLLWLSPWNPSGLPVILARPLQAKVESSPPGVTHRAMSAHQTTRLTVHNATAEELDRLGQAVMAFVTADLHLPTLDISFHADRGPCGDYYGRFTARSGSWQIQICSSDVETVYEHELAHAWVTANVDQRERSAFMKLRGLDNWADPDVPWNERGTEWAAVVIQQGLTGLQLPPALSREATSRVESFELLTGRIAPVLMEWIKKRDVPCSQRPTELSRPIEDRSGLTCALSRSVSLAN